MRIRWGLPSEVNSLRATDYSTGWACRRWVP